MRNLKRVLSLALASAMLLGMMVISSSAAEVTKVDFTDKDEITYTEAVDVMVALGVLEGSDTGAFDPDGILTREQAAKIICYMLLGAENAEKLTNNTSIFTDVAAGRWSAGYISYCANLGILAGVGDGTFDPEGELTGVAFGKMLLVILGYDPAIEEYVGANWSTAIASDMIDAGIDVKGVVLSDALTREQAAQMAFQTLTADMVKYDNKGTTVIGSDGMQVIVGASAAEKVSNKAADDYRTVEDDQDDVQQFCEKYFDKLTMASDSSDKFGRPGNTWKYDGEKVLTATEEPMATYAGKDFDKDVIEDLEDDYNITAIIYNGVTQTTGEGDDKTNVTDPSAYYEKKGQTVELFDKDVKGADKDNLTIVVSEAVAAQIDAVNLDDDDEIESIEISTIDGNHSYTVDADKDEDAFKLVGGYEEDDVLVVFLKSDADDDTDPDKAILAVDDVDTVEGTVTTASTGKWVKIDGTQYNFANSYSNASKTEVKVDSEGTFYLYNDLIVYFDGEAGKANDKYLYVVRGGESTDQWNSTTYTAEVVFVDGTCEVITIDQIGGEDVGEGNMVNETLYSYKYDSKNDDYDLTVVDDASLGSVKIEKGKTSIVDLNNTNTVKATANGATVYINISLTSKDAFDESDVYTGYKNVSSMTGSAYLVTADSGAAKYVFVVDGTVSATDDELIYVSFASKSGPINDSDLGEYYTYKAVVAGEIVEIMVDADFADAANLNKGLYDYSAIDNDGIYTELAAKDVDSKDVTKGENDVKTVDFKKAADDVITIEATKTDDSVVKTALAYADDVAVYVIGDKGAITEGSISRNYSDVASVTYTTNDDGEVTSIYIVK